MNLRRHALLLALALIALRVYTDQNGGTELHVGNFALFGALHALSVVLALEAPVPWVRRCTGVALAAVASVAVMYLGIFAVGLLSVLPVMARLYGALGACALFGAFLYGLVLRACLFSALRPRRIAQIGLACLAATLLAWTAATMSDAKALTWVIGAWWLVFSSGLGIVLRRLDPLGTQAHA